jgi:hypothetical protein
LAHTAVISLHALCCGLPTLALMAAALSGATSGLAVFARGAERLHAFMHGYEAWILALSALLVAAGGVFELAARRRAQRRAFPWLFALSVVCFALNVVIILAHRAG